MSVLRIRRATRGDDAAIWAIIEPVIRVGETYTLPSDMSRGDALDYWHAPEHSVFVAESEADTHPAVLGTYYLRANQRGGGSHVANCGYMTAPMATGRGVARAMAEHSLEAARQLGFRAMQFNFVVSSNDRAVRLWESLGFGTVGRLPKAFLHPKLGLVDGLVMFRDL